MSCMLKVMQDALSCGASAGGHKTCGQDGLKRSPEVSCCDCGADLQAGKCRPEKRAGRKLPLLSFRVTREEVLAVRTPLILIFAFFMLATLPATTALAQKPDYVSDEEEEKIRDAQDPPARIEVYLVLTQTRLDRDRVVSQQAVGSPVRQRRLYRSLTGRVHFSLPTI